VQIELRRLLLTK